MARFWRKGAYYRKALGVSVIEEIQISRRQLDDIKLAFLMNELIAASDQLRVDLKALRINRYKPGPISKHEVTLRRIGEPYNIGPFCLRRMWLSWRAQSDILGSEGFTKPSAWMKMSKPVRERRERIVRLANELPDRLGKRLYEQPWESELKGISDACAEIDQIRLELKCLGQLVKSDLRRRGHKPADEGRPIEFSRTNTRDLRAYSRYLTSGGKADRSTVSFFESPNKPLTNPDHRKAARTRMNTAFSRIRAWLNNIEKESQEDKKLIKPSLLRP